MSDPYAFADDMSDLDYALTEGDRLYHFYKEQELIWESDEAK